MTKDEFHNALRILSSIDWPEFAEANIAVKYTEWLHFCRKPYEWFITANDENADKLWTIIERRMKR